MVRGGKAAGVALPVIGTGRDFIHLGGKKVVSICEYSLPGRPASARLDQSSTL